MAEYDKKSLLPGEAEKSALGEQSGQKLKVVLCWHMHQPEYRDLRKNEYQLPWTYLHAIKDYVDMAAHLENIDGARAVINFTPTLLEQIEDYKCQARHFLRNNTPLRDPLLASLMADKLPTSPPLRLQLIKDCLRANKERLIDPFPPYRRLADMAHWFLQHQEMVYYLSDQYLFDLLTWHHLAWMGETVRRNDSRVKRLISMESDYTLNDRYLLMEVISELLGNLVERYRLLALEGKVELSVTPYAHPIMPLMLDMHSAKDAIPNVLMPENTEYPGGEERIRWHLHNGLDVFKNHFGFKPNGCWPSEGSVSDRTLELLSEYGFKWVASGGSVLDNSLHKSGLAEKVGTEGGIHRAYQVGSYPISCYFRDDGLSDLIGFTYSKWHAEDATNNLITHLETIYHARPNQSGRVVSIILDGENAWEYYPENGYYFLKALYEKIAKHPLFKLSTFSEASNCDSSPVHIPSLVAGSWVYGSFSTWIGDTAKNRGWDMLIEAKRCYDKVIETGELDDAQLGRAEQQLAVCEGSDWFWWFGDYNPAESVSSFESLFRLNLTILYQYLGVSPPSYLTLVFTHGAGHPAAGGTMRPGQERK